ncbi:MAG: hypothetical protein SV487_01090, partial [Thermodesulfobacteriota bacterium]|nr:hypothetical protein [Thermodesulfobacteriota bacterium]
GLYTPPLMAMAVDIGRESGFMSRVMSLLELAFSLGMVIGPLLAGLIKETFSLGAIFLAGGSIGAAASLLSLVIHLRTPAADSPAG